jgi:hypothetical protein
MTSCDLRLTWCFAYVQEAIEAAKVKAVERLPDLFTGVDPVVVAKRMQVIEDNAKASYATARGKANADEKAKEGVQSHVPQQTVAGSGSDGDKPESQPAQGTIQTVPTAASEGPPRWTKHENDMYDKGIAGNAVSLDSWSYWALVIQAHDEKKRPKAVAYGLVSGNQVSRGTFAAPFKMAFGTTRASVAIIILDLHCSPIKLRCVMCRPSDNLMNP